MGKFPGGGGGAAPDHSVQNRGSENCWDQNHHYHLGENLHLVVPLPT